MKKYIFICNLFSSPAVILCSKSTAILLLETKLLHLVMFAEEHM